MVAESHTIGLDRRRRCDPRFVDRNGRIVPRERHYRRANVDGRNAFIAHPHRFCLFIITRRTGAILHAGYIRRHHRRCDQPHDRSLRNARRRRQLAVDLCKCQPRALQNSDSRYFQPHSCIHRRYCRWSRRQPCRVARSWRHAILETDHRFGTFCRAFASPLARLGPHHADALPFRYISIRLDVWQARTGRTFHPWRHCSIPHCGRRNL